MASPRGPDAVEDYDIEHLTGDLVAAAGSPEDREGDLLRPRLGRHRGLADAAAATRTAPPGVIGLNTPVHRRARRSIRSRSCATAWARTCTSSTSRSPARPTRCWPRTSRKTMRFFMRRPRSAWHGRGRRGLRRRARSRRDPSTFALVKILQMYDPASIRGGKLLTDEELAVFVETFDAHRLHRRHQLVSQLHPQLGALGGPVEQKVDGPLADGHGRAGRGAAALRRRRHGSLSSPTWRRR